MKTFRSAFTLVEVMIVVVIVGLILAMLIPACSKVRDSMAIRKHDSGAMLSPDEQERYEEAMGRHGSSRVQVTNNGGFTPVSSTLADYGTMDVNGKKYFMVPADKIQSKTEVNGVTYYLVPAK